jgi:outer membrane receptor protein involved in Fe transport
MKNTICFSATWKGSLLALFLVNMALSALASTPVTGIVVDESGISVPYAAVAAYSLPDSGMVSGTSTDDLGQFDLQLRNGSYFLEITFLSYEEKRLPIEARGKALDLGKITMTIAAEMLDEVVIQAERSQMELQLDKKVFNVGKDLSTAGGTAADILDRVPSVNVDVEGNVSLRGSTAVRILVNGKPSGLVQNGNPQSLRQLQGNLIESIEVITNPSSKYDAEGEVGILNIVLKEQRGRGVNGSFDLNTGWPHDHGAAMNLNYRNKWFNIFMSEGISYEKNPGGGTSYQNYFFPDTAYSFERIYDQTRSDLSNNFRLGADFYATDKDIITLSGLYQYATGKNLSTTTYNDFNAEGAATGTTERYQDELETEHTVEIDLSYKKEFDKKDQEFSATVKFDLSQDFEDAVFTEDAMGTGSDVDARQRSENLEYEKNWLFQADYQHPFGNKGLVETGFKSTLRIVDNDFTVEDEVAPGVYEILPGFDNQIIYTENIYAAYLTAGEQWGNFSAKAGLRMEYSDIKTELLVTEESNPRSYVDFFPSAYLGQKIKEMNTLQLSYSRRLSRPNFWSLLPFFQYSDTRNYFSGNPDLNPEYTHSIELGYQRYLEKGNMLTSVYYRYKTGVIERVTFYDEVRDVQRNIPINLGTAHNFGWEFSMNYDFFDWWTANGTVNVYNENTSGSYQGIDLSNNYTAMDFKLSTKFTIADNLDLQPSFRFDSPHRTAQGSRKATYALDFAAGLKVFKGKGKLTFSFQDILDSRKWRWESSGENFDINGDFQWRQGRRVKLSFNYRLEKEK